MKFFEEKIGKVVDKWTVRAKETAEKEVTKTINYNIEAGLDALRGIAVFGIAALAAAGLDFLNSTEKKGPRHTNHETYTFNITNNYYGSNHRGGKKHAKLG